MLDALYLKSIEKKEDITDFFENIARKIDIEKVNKEYVKQDFTKNKQDKNFAAIDGSFNKKKFMAGYVYAITSQTIISKAEKSILKYATAADLNTLSTIHNQRIEKILSLHMNIFELKSTLNTLRNHRDIHYMLLDGSIRGSLMNFRPVQNIPPEIMRIFPKYYEIIEEHVKENEMKIGITSEDIKGLIAHDCEEIIENHNLDIKYEDIEMDVKIYLDGIEQLYCIYYLLTEFKDKIICVSKTSGTKSLFKESIPDAAVIEYTCPYSGYTHPRELPPTRIVREIGNEKRVIKFPIKNEEISSNVFTTMYTKLNNKSNVLKIEFSRKINEDELIQILKDLESISVNGYPHILKKAHDEVKIKSKYIDRICHNYGLNEKTGRDMVN